MVRKKEGEQKSTHVIQKWSKNVSNRRKKRRLSLFSLLFAAAFSTIFYPNPRSLFAQRGRTTVSSRSRGQKKEKRKGEEISNKVWAKGKSRCDVRGRTDAHDFQAIPRKAKETRYRRARYKGKCIGAKRKKRERERERERKRKRKREMRGLVVEGRNVNESVLRQKRAKWSKKAFIGAIQKTRAIKEMSWSQKGFLKLNLKNVEK